MLKRFKVWSYLALAAGASLFHIGSCAMPYNGDAGSWPRIITAILREDIFS